MPKEKSPGRPTTRRYTDARRGAVTVVSSADGRTFTPQRWSTPITDYRSFDGRRIGAFGRARWHPADAPSFDYFEFHVDGISYLEPGCPDREAPTPVVVPDRVDARREGRSG